MSKYVIYKGTEGLINMLGGIAYCTKWCIENNHILMIDLRSNPYYKSNFSNFFYLKNCNFIEDYDLIDNNFEEINLAKLKDFNPKIIYEKNVRKYIFDDLHISKSLYSWNFNSSIKIYCGNGGICRQYINKYIRIKNNILVKILKYDLTFKFDEYLAIHFRNTDLSNNIYNFYNKIEQYKNIYVATDDYQIVNNLKKKYPDKEFLSYSEPENTKIFGMHYVKKNKFKLIFNLLVDIYICMLSNDFVGSPNSSISRIIFYLKKQKNNIFNKN